MVNALYLAFPAPVLYSCYTVVFESAPHPLGGPWASPMHRGSRHRQRVIRNATDTAGPSDRQASLIAYKTRMRPPRACADGAVEGRQAMERLLRGAAAQQEDREMRLRARYLLSEWEGIRQRGSARAVEAHLVHAVRVIRELEELHGHGDAAPSRTARRHGGGQKGQDFAHHIDRGDAKVSKLAFTPPAPAAPPARDARPHHATMPTQKADSPPSRADASPAVHFEAYTGASSPAGPTVADDQRDSDPPLWLDVSAWSRATEDPSPSSPRALPVDAKSLPRDANDAYQRALEGPGDTAAARLARERDAVQLCCRVGRAAADALTAGAVAATGSRPSRLGSLLLHPASGAGGRFGAGDLVHGKAAGQIRRATAALERRGARGALCAAPLTVVDWAGTRWLAAAALPPAAAGADAASGTHWGTLAEAAAAANLAFPALERAGLASRPTPAGAHSAMDGRVYLVNPVLALPAEADEEGEEGREPACLLVPEGEEPTATPVLLRPRPHGMPAAVRRALGVGAAAPLEARPLKGDWEGAALIGPPAAHSRDSPNPAASRLVGEPVCGPRLVVGCPLRVRRCVLQLRPEVRRPSFPPPHTNSLPRSPSW